MLGKMKRFIITVIFAVLVELAVFQGEDIWKNIDPSFSANHVYGISDFERVNWIEQDDGSLLSDPDPMLVLMECNFYTDEIYIEADAVPELPFVDIFYTNETYKVFGEKYLHIEDVESNCATITINDNIQSLRIDLGDYPNYILTGLKVVINPAEIDPSISRILAMILIYWCGAFLFSLQKMPDYHLGESSDR